MLLIYPQGQRHEIDTNALSLSRASNLSTYIFVLYISEFRTFQAFFVFPWLYNMYMRKKGVGLDA